MNPTKVDDDDYINYLIAARRVFTCTEAARSQPAPLGEGASENPAHDSFNRLLERSFRDRGSLRREAKPLVSMNGGILLLDKPYAKKMELVTSHWSGKHHDVVLDINLVMTLWTGGDRLVPCGLRAYDKPMGEEGPIPASYPSTAGTRHWTT